MKTEMPADLSRLVELLDTYKQSIITRWECASHNPDGCLCSRHEREKRQALLAAIAEICEERDRLATAFAKLGIVIVEKEAKHG